MEDKQMANSCERYLHRAATFVGGYAAMYTVLIRLNLGSSQTVNLLNTLSALLGANKREFLLRLLGTLLFGCSVFAASYLKKKGWTGVRLLCGGLCAASFIVLGFMPVEVDHCAGLYPTFISMPFLWVTFGSACGYASAPIFSTNNYRQLIGGLAEYAASHEKASLDKAKFFGGTLVVFHIAAALSWFACTCFAEKAAFFGVIPCIALCALELAPSHVFGKAKLHRI